jgi:ribose/xylose/arabinose/galactoside ABC-type transport system permease subunit
MLTKGVLAIILRTIIALSLGTISGSTIAIGALGELIVKLKKMVIARGVKLLKRRGVYKKGKRSARF